MTLKKAMIIVLLLAESKWYHCLWFRKLTEEQKEALSFVSQYIQHGKF